MPVFRSLRKSTWRVIYFRLSWLTSLFDGHCSTIIKADYLFHCPHDIESKDVCIHRWFEKGLTGYKGSLSTAVSVKSVLFVDLCDTDIVIDRQPPRVLACLWRMNFSDSGNWLSNLGADWCFFFAERKSNKGDRIVLKVKVKVVECKYPNKEQRKVFRAKCQYTAKQPL